jgi:hypothetical protein
LIIQPGDLVYIFNRGAGIFIREEKRDMTVPVSEEKIIVKYREVLSSSGVETFLLNRIQKISDR